MPRTCTICTHPERSAIEAAIAQNSSYRVISRQFSIGHDSVQRHATAHIEMAIKESQAAKEEAAALDVVKQLKAINNTTLAILKEARTDKKPMTALAAIDRIHKQLELQAKLLGDLDERPQVNVLLSPEWLTVRGAITSALAPYSEAREAVALALGTIGGAHGHRN